MKRETISDALELLDDQVLQEAQALRGGRRSRSGVWRLGAAACLCLAVLGAVLLRPGSTGPGGLPLLTLPELSGNGMGFTGVLLYNRSQLDTGNPWDSSAAVETLPVYENGSYNDLGLAVGLSKGEMLERLERAAQALGVEIGETEYERAGFTPSLLSPTSIVRITACAQGVRLQADADGTLTVKFEEGLDLPEGYSFTYYDTTQEEGEAALQYLAGRFSALTGLEDPVLFTGGSYVMWNDYNQDGELVIEPRLEREYRLYEDSEDRVEALLNYTFRPVYFYPDEEGRLSIIRLYDGLCCGKKLGDYPVITAQEATELLLEGRYLTNVPYEIQDESLVGEAQLVYRTGAGEKVLMPYYRFDVELPEMRREDGPTDFGAYYVPAVREEYLKNMPEKDPA